MIFHRYPVALSPFPHAGRPESVLGKEKRSYGPFYINSPLIKLGSPSPGRLTAKHHKVISGPARIVGAGFPDLMTALGGSIVWRWWNRTGVKIFDSVVRIRRTAFGLKQRNDMRRQIMTFASFNPG